MNPVKNPLLIAMTAVMVMTACAPASPSPVTAPVVPPPASGQGVVTRPADSLTSTVARSNPTGTSSKTQTAFPSITPLPATATQTPFGFVASLTPTPVVIPTSEPPDPAEGNTNDWGSDYRCSLINKSPENWQIVKLHNEVQVTWTLLNSGTRTWQAGQILLVYFDGVSLTSPAQKKKNLPRDVKVGQTIDATIKIITPRDPGHYRSVWALRYVPTNETFCTFTVKIFAQ